MIHTSKKVDKERSESLGINHENLIRGAIIGTANLYEVKQYKSKAELEKDKNKHYADIKKFGAYKYGFLIRDANRFRTSVAYSGQLKFFEIEYPISL